MEIRPSDDITKSEPGESNIKRHTRQRSSQNNSRFGETNSRVICASFVRAGSCRPVHRRPSVTESERRGQE